MSMFIDKMIEAGGAMLPLALCSVISIAVIIERFMHLRRKYVIDDQLVAQASQFVGKGQLDQARELGQNSPTLFGTILDKGIETHQIENSELEQALVECAGRAMPKLERFLNVLALIGSIAPLLGLFGTVYGMILSFDEIARESVDKELMARGISVALITTGTGLVIAIPAIIANNYFRARVDLYYSVVEEGILKVMRAYHVGQQPAQQNASAEEQTHGQD